MDEERQEEFDEMRRVFELYQEQLNDLFFEYRKHGNDIEHFSSLYLSLDDFGMFSDAEKEELTDIWLQKKHEAMDSQNKTRKEAAKLYSDFINRYNTLTALYADTHVTQAGLPDIKDSIDGVISTFPDLKVQQYQKVSGF